MSMLKYFFEIGSDPDLFDGLKIAQEKKLCEEYNGAVSGDIGKSEKCGWTEL